MARPHLKPTTVQRLRPFLAAHGFETRPWDGADEVLDELTDLLQARRDDPGFWGPLRGLLRQLVRDAEDPDGSDRLPAAEAEILQGAEIGAIIGEIRSVLADPRQTERSAWLQRLSAPALCFVLMLGMAAGCTKATSKAAGASSDPPAPAPVTAGKDTGMKVGGATAKVELGSAAEKARPEPVVQPKEKPREKPKPKTVHEYVAGSNLRSYLKRRLSRCLRRFSDSRRAKLVEVFATKSPEEIAKHLERIATRSPCKPQPARPAPRPMYKGVCFD
ncbi:MAG: hypothetical protein ABI333_20580 [bacterium]